MERGARFAVDGAGRRACASTEHEDALKIVATIVEALADRRVSFVFASHIHGLATHQWLSKKKNVKTIHMRVDQDADGDLVFNRTLQPGMPDAKLWATRGEEDYQEQQVYVDDLSQD